MRISCRRCGADYICPNNRNLRGTVSRAYCSDTCRLKAVSEANLMRKVLQGTDTELDYDGGSYYDNFVDRRGF